MYVPVGSTVFPITVFQPHPWLSSELTMPDIDIVMSLLQQIHTKVSDLIREGAEVKSQVYITQERVTTHVARIMEILGERKDWHTRHEQWLVAHEQGLQQLREEVQALTKYTEKMSRIRKAVYAFLSAGGFLILDHLFDIHKWWSGDK